MITYSDYRRLVIAHGEEKVNRWFPRTVAAMWRNAPQGQGGQPITKDL